MTANATKATKAPDRSGRLAITSLVTAVVGLIGFGWLNLAFGVLSFVAVALGIAAVRRMDATRGSGRLAATLGYLLGGVGVVLVVFLAVGLAITGGEGG